MHFSQILNSGERVRQKIYHKNANDGEHTPNYIIPVRNYYTTVGFVRGRSRDSQRGHGPKKWTAMGKRQTTRQKFGMIRNETCFTFS